MVHNGYVLLMVRITLLLGQDIRGRHQVSGLGFGQNWGPGLRASNMFLVFAPGPGAFQLGNRRFGVQMRDNYNVTALTCSTKIRVRGEE